MVFLVELTGVKLALCEQIMDNSTCATTDVLHAQPSMTIEPFFRNTTMDNITLGINDDNFHRQIRCAFQVTRIVFIIFGIIGNGLSVALFSQRIRRQKSAASIYFMSLALSDGMLITSSNLMSYFDELETPVSLFTISHCTYTVLLEPPARFSALLILVITIDRFFALYFPLKFHRLVSKRRLLL